MILRLVCVLYLCMPSVTFGQSLIDPGMRSLAPAVDLRQLRGPPLVPGSEGRRITDATLRGSPLLVEFWWSRCGHCDPIHDHVRALAHHFADSGLVVLSLSLDTDTTTIARWIDSHGDSSLAVFAQASPRTNHFVSYNAPRVVLVDRRGYVAWDQTGSGISLADLPTLVRALLAETTRGP